MQSFMKNTQLKGAFLTLFGGICWGASGSVGQYLFAYEGMDSRWLVPIRLGLAGIILIAYSFFLYGKHTLDPWRTWKDARDLVIYGLLGISFCQFLYFTTIQLSSAAIGTILQDLSPVMILAVSCMQARRAPSHREVLSIMLALLGVYLLTTHGDLGHLAIPPAALAAGVLCAVCVTIYNVYPKRLLSQYPVAMLQGWAFLMGSVFLLIVFRPWTYGYVPTPIGYAGIAFVVIVGNVLAFTCYMTGVKLIGPEKSILYGFSEPATAAIITVTLFHQPATLGDAAGFACIFGMLWLISHQAEPEEKKKTYGKTALRM